MELAQRDKKAYSGAILAAKPGDTIYYYIRARDQTTGPIRSFNMPFFR